jgi:hypothetical protein
MDGATKVTTFYYFTSVLVWFGLVWFGLVWLGLVWFGLVLFVYVQLGLSVCTCAYVVNFVLARVYFTKGPLRNICS